jgi:hypothetical protein
VKRRTLRGRLDTSELRRLIVDDGRLNHGYRVVSFVVFPYAPAGGTQQTPVTLGLDYDMGANMDASDNRQIGWAVTVYGSGALEGGQISVIDPDHVIIQDLWIRNENAVDEVNYLIELEPVDLNDDQAILSLIKERSQDDLR